MIAARTFAHLDRPNGVGTPGEEYFRLEALVVMADDLIAGGAELSLHLRIHLDDQAIAESNRVNEPIPDLELDDVT